MSSKPYRFRINAQNYGEEEWIVADLVLDLKRPRAWCLFYEGYGGNNPATEIMEELSKILPVQPCTVRFMTSKQIREAIGRSIYADTVRIEAVPTSLKEVLAQTRYSPNNPRNLSVPEVFIQGKSSHVWGVWGISPYLLWRDLYLRDLI